MIKLLYQCSQTGDGNDAPLRREGYTVIRNVRLGESNAQRTQADNRNL